jgi:hypothetical protein
MNWWIAAFLAVGAAFGLATYSKRHLFSEGATRDPGNGSRDALDGRLVWVVLCTGLWPIYVLTGLFSLWRRSRRS